MVWRLELVGSDDVGPPERLTVFELGEIGAPSDLDGVGVDLKTSHRVLREVQRAVVALQERALKAKAALIRRIDPTLSLKDYRSRSVQTLFGTFVIRIPRLKRRGSRLAPPCFFRSFARSAAEYDELRGRLGAFMSFRTAERLLGDLFPFSGGRSRSTTQRHVRRQAAKLDGTDCEFPVGLQPTVAIDLGIDTAFVRNAAAEGPRHHEVLIGVGANDRGESVKIGAVIAAVDEPHRIIESTLRALGRTDSTRITTFTDGDKMLRGYLKKAGLGPPLLDWAHLARRVQIAKITAKGLRHLTKAERRARPLIMKAMESLHWRLWHGQIDGAREAMKRVVKLLRPFDIDRTRAGTATAAKKLRAAIGKLEDYIVGQSAYLTNYGLRQRQGRPVGTATTVGLANTLVNRRMNKLQQMRWSADGAHAVITLRTHSLNDLGKSPIALNPQV